MVGLRSLSQNTWTWCDIIIVLYVLPDLSGAWDVAMTLEGFLEILVILPEMRGGW